MTGGGHHHAPMPSDWRFTVQSIAIENRTLSINKGQYKFVKELGSGAFGSVYAARTVPDSRFIDSLVCMHTSFSLIQIER